MRMRSEFEYIKKLRSELNKFETQIKEAEEQYIQKFSFFKIGDLAKFFFLEKERTFQIEKVLVDKEGRFIYVSGIELLGEKFSLALTEEEVKKVKV